MTGAPLYNSAATLVEHGDTTTVYPEAPAGPTREIFPIDETPPVTTRYPPVVLGPQILINVPALPTTGIIDGPGSYVPPFGPGGAIYDTSTPESDPGPAGDPDADGPAGTPTPQPGWSPDWPVPTADNAGRFPPDDFEDTEYSVDELAALAYRHTGSGDMHIGGSARRPTEAEVLDTLRRGEPTPLDGQNAVKYVHNGIRVIVNRDMPWQSTSNYIRR